MPTKKQPITGNHFYCMAPDEGTVLEDGKTCGEPAVQEREVEGILFPLCQEHVDQLDEEG